MVQHKEEWNGRLKINLSWPQFIWGIGTLVLLTAGWADLRSRVGTIEQSVTANLARTQEEIDRLAKLVDTNDATLRAELVELRKLMDTNRR